MVEAEVRRWEPRAVVSFIEECRGDGGIPQFRATIGGKPFQVNGENAVLGVCWGGWRRGGHSVLFLGVPEEDLSLIMEVKGEWKLLLEKLKNR